MIWGDDPKFDFGGRQYRDATVAHFLDLSLSDQTKDVKERNIENAPFEVFCEFHLIQQDIWVLVAPIEPVLNLPDTLHGTLQVRVSTENDEGGIGSAVEGVRLVGAPRRGPCSVVG